MTVPYSFSAATSAIPLSQLDDNFNTTITLGNTAIQLGNTVTTLNNMTLANVTISSGNVTITNVTVTTANVTTVNATTVIATTANVTTANVATSIVTGSETLSYGTVNGVAYLNGSKVLTTGSALVFDGTNLATTGTSTGLRLIASSTDAGGSVLQVDTTATSYGRVGGSTTMGYVAGTQSLWTIGGSEQMRLTSTGLGIGTSSPAAKLDVNGTAAISGAVTLSGGTANGVLYLNGSKVATSGSALTFDGTTLALNANQTFDNARVLQWKNTSGVTRPVLQIFSDNNLYIDSEDGSQIFRTGGSEQMRLTSTGLGIGTSSPANTLNVVKDNTAARGQLSLQTVTASNFAQITFYDQTTLSAQFYQGYGTDKAINIVNPLAHGIALWTNNTERARITSGGYSKFSNDGTYVSATGSYHEFRSNDATNFCVDIGSTSASFTAGGVVLIRANRNTTNNTFYALSYYNDVAGAFKFRVADSGDVTNTNGTYGTISDAKMKADIVDAGSQWADIKALRFRKFKMKDDPSGLVQLGVVAQEVELTSPGLVDEHQDRDAEGNDLGTTTKSVKTSVLLMKAAVALQEAMSRIEALEAQVAQLKGA